MGLEIEVKYLDADHAAIRRALRNLGAVRLGRWFEANAVYDDAQRSLKARGTLLRLRAKPGAHVLTLKRAAADRQSDTAKVYEEHETHVSDPAALAAILGGLGYSPALRYEKIREKWTLHGCEICLDTLPFGQFLEIEGDEDGIRACAEALALPASRASTATYHELNRRWREASGLAPDESFVFTPERQTELLAEAAE
jgi:adenylate cyclase class 2